MRIAGETTAGSFAAVIALPSPSARLVGTATVLLFFRMPCCRVRKHHVPLYDYHPVEEGRRGCGYIDAGDMGGKEDYRNEASCGLYCHVHAPKGAVHAAAM